MKAQAFNVCGKIGFKNETVMKLRTLWNRICNTNSIKDFVTFKMETPMHAFHPV